MWMRMRLLTIYNVVITFRYPHPCGYSGHYPLCTYAVMVILDYYLNLSTKIMRLLVFVSLNKLIFHLLHNS
jgi:hypothetical protein